MVMEKNRKIIKIVIFVTVIGGVLLAKYLPGVVPYWQCSEVYKRYHKVEGVRATYIKNYPLNDTLTVGVTLLEATDSAGWEVLQRDFELIPLPPEALAFFDTNSVNLCLASKDDYCKGKDSIILNNDVIAVSYYRQQVSVFSIVTEKQLDAISEHLAKSIKK